jgi:hypothetical protein
MGNRAHILAFGVWRKVLWSDEITFLIGGRTMKERVRRKRGERCCPTCIQHQLHRGYLTPVHAWGTIGYRYKSPLLFIHGSGKSGAFMQKDYLAQVLEPYIQGFLEDMREPPQIETPAQWNLCLWKIAIQPTATNLNRIVAQCGEQPTGLFLCLTLQLHLI